MTAINKLELLKKFAQKELTQNIIPFWHNNTIDTLNGGFVASISNNNSKALNNSKGLILNSRILWTFSIIFKNLKQNKDLELAKRAYNYLLKYFYDRENKGFYWSVNPDGSANDEKKQIYAQAFAIYGLSEYYKVTQNQEALDKAIETFNLIEKYSYDKNNGGYFDARSGDWKSLTDSRLSEKDLNAEKTMNTHLHILEAYANLYSVWPDEILAKQLEGLINVFKNIIISPDDSHLILFFDEKWNILSSEISYGHDIEAGWLIHEAAIILNKKDIEQLAVTITNKALEGYNNVGALVHEDDRQGIHTDHEIEWWPQAESLVGLINCYEITGEEKYLDYAVSIMNFIENYIVDKKHGEWFYRVNLNGNPINSYEKVGFWKCPYHNSRACIEIINRTDKLLKG